MFYLNCFFSYDLDDLKMYGGNIILVLCCNISMVVNLAGGSSLCLKGSRKSALYVQSINVKLILDSLATRSMEQRRSQL